MEVLYSWLQEAAGIEVPPARAAALLTRQGVNVERVRPVAEGLAGVVAARVEECTPLTDRLTRVVIDAGGRKAVVVTGAEVRAGSVHAWAPPGAHLPDGRELGVALFQGQESQGMLLSAREMDLGPEEDGLLDLGDVPPGSDLAELLGLPDAIFEIDLTPNLAAFCQDVTGLAQEMRAALGLAPSLPAPQALAPGAPALRVELPPGALVRQYLGAVVETGKAPVTPLWMKRRLWGSGSRTHGGFVDVTNYLLYERGQPMHAFDLDRVRGPIRVRQAKDGERLITLDHVERVLRAGDIVIADDEGAIGLGGVMGGERTAVGPTTRRIFLEAAVFAPAQIRRTARRLGIASEAAGRFEKGIDEDRVALALTRAMDLLTDMGVSSVRAVTAEVPVPPRATTMSIRPGRVRDLLGLDVGTDVVADVLRRLGLSVGHAQDQLTIEVPPRRRDIEGEADVAEEVGRITGYDSLPETVLAAREPGRRLPIDRFSDEVRQVLAGLGLIEHWGPSFVSPEDLERIAMPGVAIENPLTREASRLRPSLLPSLLAACAHNVSRQNDDLRYFELGRVFRPTGGWPAEGRRLGVASGGTAPDDWRHRGTERDFFDLKGLIEAMAARLQVPLTFVVESAPAAYLHPGRQVTLAVGGGAIGSMGELHPALAAQLDLPPLCLAEMDLERLLEARGIPAYRPFSRHPFVERDLAIVFPDALRYEEVAGVLAAGKRPLLSSARLFDVYRGGQVPDGHRSLAVRLRFQADERTLADVEVDEAIDDSLADLARLGGRVRA